jgi:uncharacterized membrane protein
MEEVLQTTLNYLVMFVEVCGAAVVVSGVIRALVTYGYAYFSASLYRRAASLRLQLGQSLVVGLEFQVAADILKTTLDPSWNDILLLVVLVALRTGLNYILEWELHNIMKEDGRLHPNGESDEAEET